MKGRHNRPTRTTLLILGILLPGSSGAPSHAEDILIPGVIGRDYYDRCTGLIDGQGYFHLLENLGPFGLGDSVVAIGSTWTTLECGGTAWPYLPGNAIAPRRGFDLGCGILSIEPEYGCPFLSSERYGLIALAAAGGFSDGDTVRVVGDLRLDCTAIPECGAPICLDANTAAPCVTPTVPTTWGMIRALFHN